MNLQFNGKSIFDCTRDELELANHMLRRAWSVMQQKATTQFAVGDTVEFTGRGESLMTGQVRKINRKTVSVLVGHVRWKVSSSLLRKVPSEAGIRQQ